MTEGWWNLKPSACETLLRGPLAAQFYYVYAMDERGGEWKGKAFMCTRDREFRIDGRENCLVRGFDRTGFFEVDTGKDAKNWTVQLTDSASRALTARRQSGTIMRRLPPRQDPRHARAGLATTRS